MRFPALILTLFLGTYLCGAQESIRKVDFKNFTYPLSGRLLGHDRLEWLDVGKHAKAKKPPIHLVRGSDLTKTSGSEIDGEEYAEYEGFTLESVKFADLTGDGQDEAIVVLRYHTGGTQTTDYVMCTRLMSINLSFWPIATQVPEHTPGSTMFMEKTGR